MPTAPLASLLDGLGADPEPDAVYAAFEQWAASRGMPLYPHQSDALFATLAGANTIITTPTGSGKSLIATAAHVSTLAARGRVYYTAPIKALVSEKFFAWCDDFGADLVGMVTGDASVNPDAPIICCTAEILANMALREGRTADVDLVVADEFHFIADPDRGWAWQVATSELPQAQFMIMSATLGDVTDLATRLERTTGRPTEVIANAVRPVPLTYRWSLDPLPATLEELVHTGQAPVYLVHPSQAAATEQAQGLMSMKLVDTEQRHRIVEAMGGFRFARGFGATLSKLLRSGIGVHHAGLLPKYRRLVETLAQQGLLRVICGTDTLGVGINVPIRTVVFTTLTKFDGRRQRVLRSREFHQIAGRAGRPGFDPVGNVIVQAPEYQIENERILAKFAGDEKKLKSVRRKKPPEGVVNYTEATFDKLVASVPETLHARLTITHAMLINLLHRDDDTAAALVHLVDEATPDPGQRRRLLRHAVQLARSMVQAGLVVRRPVPTPGGRLYDLAPSLQDDFALNQPLSAFAMRVIDSLTPEMDDYAMSVVSVIEATLEDPMAILVAQQFKERGEVVADLKSEGYDYEERQEILAEVTWPQPLAEELSDRHAAMSKTHPWLVEHPLRPKSIVRDMVERAMTFAEYVAFYKVQRSEGLLLRYLSDAWRALRQTVPAAAHTEELDDIIVWLGELIRATDSSLVDEWEALTDPGAHTQLAREAAQAPPRPLTGNARAFRVLVRNAMFRRVQLCADDDVDGLAELDSADPDATFTADDWDAALGDYWDEHDRIGTGAAARAPALLVVTGQDTRTWHVRQIIDDPAGNHDWAIVADADLDASDETGELRLHVHGLSRLD
ncbi:DEAD/DEAH box helicase [Brooklawnia cerclae]|uniref:DEAD/DEAH box helicase n=1 Tax=Brooklawnia cerclae TaxID=349934 RepID=UPI0033712039